MSLPGAEEQHGDLQAPMHAEDLWTRMDFLSPREIEIVRLVARDRTNKEISRVLGISVWTVGTHMRRVFAKLGVHSRAAMVAVAMETARAGQSGGMDRLRRLPREGRAPGAGPA